VSGIPHWAVKGAKVVCVNSLNIWLEEDGSECGGPLCDEVCTIVAVEVEPDGQVALFFEEYPELPDESGYLLKWFRPLVSLEEDINTHFAQYLKTDHRATEKERA
jgi:hypothetical protein